MSDEFRYLAIGGGVRKIKNGSFVLNCKVLDADEGFEIYKNCLRRYDMGKINDLDREILIKHQPHFLVKRDNIENLEEIVSNFVLGKRNSECVWIDGINLCDVNQTIKYLDELREKIDTKRYYMISIVDFDVKGDY